MDVTIIYGGRSGEHEISLVSAAAVARGMDRKHNISLIGITKKGRWYLQDKKLLEKIRTDNAAALYIEENENMSVSVVPGAGHNSLVADGNPIRTDVVFPVLHGSYGEDGTVQGLFEMAGLPYVGCTNFSSALTMDKEKTKMILESVGIPVVPYVCMKRHVMMNSAVYDEFIKATVEELGFPMFVKPCCAGSSNGAARADNVKELSYTLMEAFQWDNKVLLEKAINAREVECSVTGNSVTYPADSETETVTAYIPGEIVPTHKFYDYDAKYNDSNGASLKIPADLSENDIEKIRKTACAAYRAVDGTGLCRVDFFIDRDSGAVYLNEINSMPGFTPISMFPKMCAAAGLEFTALTELLLEEAVALFRTKSELNTSR